MGIFCKNPTQLSMNSIKNGKVWALKISSALSTPITRVYSIPTWTHQTQASLVWKAPSLASWFHSWMPLHEWFSWGKQTTVSNNKFSLSYTEGLTLMEVKQMFILCSWGSSALDCGNCGKLLRNWDWKTMWRLSRCLTLDEPWATREMELITLEEDITSWWVEMVTILPEISMAVNYWGLCRMSR